MIGTSHRHGSLQSRLPMTASSDAVRALVRRLRREPAIHEALLLATCNRFEVYVVGDPADALESAITAAVTDITGTDLLGDRSPRMKLEGPAVRQHLGRVACGLESAILGESEVMGQIRRAATLAGDVGALGPVLQSAITAALRAGRRSRTATAISRGVQSITSAAVNLAVRDLGALGGRPALVVGAGETARQALVRLRAEGVDPLFVVSRSSTHAHAAAAATGAVPLPLDRLPRALAVAPFVLTATHTAAPLIDPSMLPIRRRLPNQVLIDLSVPSAIDARMAAEPGVKLHQLADVEFLVRAALEHRRRDVPAVEAIVAQEVGAL